jgi:hypothetical protein
MRCSVPDNFIGYNQFNPPWGYEKKMCIPDFYDRLFPVARTAPVAGRAGF